MRAIVSTASTGYFPAADSAESITPSVPSRIALATSEASARVGRGFSIMLSSIWVAVMTTLPRPLAFLMMTFCRVGTDSVETSTPRSPRATITPSVASSTASRASMASRFSILAMRGWVPPRDVMRAFASRTSAALRTKDRAT